MNVQVTLKKYHLKHPIMVINEIQQSTEVAERDTSSSDVLVNEGVNRIITFACLSIFPLIYLLGRAIIDWAN